MFVFCSFVETNTIVYVRACLKNRAVLTLGGMNIYALCSWNCYLPTWRVNNSSTMKDVKEFKIWYNKYLIDKAKANKFCGLASSLRSPND